jgi:hypothetical protein
VAMPIVNSAPTSVILRPRLSPRCPKKIAPSGRVIMAAPKTANDANNAALSLPAGKNKWGKTKTDRRVDVKIVKFNGRTDEARENHTRA